MRNTNKAARLTALAVGVTLAVAACGEDDGGGGGTDSAAALDGKSFTVGSKEFTEQVILGQIAILALEDAGATVKDETGIVGTTNVRKALESDEIDMYWEYTGTGWTEILGNETADAPTDPQELFDAVAEQDSKNGISWIAKTSANDTYAFATSQETSDEFSVTSLSQYAELVKSDPESASMCAAAEFLDRADGFPGVEKAYGFSLPDDQITEVDLEHHLHRSTQGRPMQLRRGVRDALARSPPTTWWCSRTTSSYFVGYEVAMTVQRRGPSRTLQSWRSVLDADRREAHYRGAAA
ncbi:MAG: glycine betaine ABC transporter substrate-binding protein, partial [Nocardioidaceae bacterium]